MSKYDNKPLEQELDENVTEAAARFALVGLKFVARGGDLDEARAKISVAASVSSNAEDHARAASLIITSKALAFFEVNLPEAQAEGKIYLEEANALEEARKEEAKVKQEWAQARNELQSQMGSGNKGNGFKQAFTLDLNQDGSATLSPEAVAILVKATMWQNKGKVAKVSGYLNATEDSKLTLEIVVSNPAKAKS